MWNYLWFQFLFYFLIFTMNFWHTYDLAYAYVQVCATVQVYNKVGKGYIVIINHYLGDNFWLLWLEPVLLPIREFLLVATIIGSLSSSIFGLRYSPPLKMGWIYASSRYTFKFRSGSVALSNVSLITASCNSINSRAVLQPQAWTRWNAM